jgi:signal transduction histidine kinase
MRVLVDAVEPAGAVPTALFRDVYRLVQEASVNAARHGKATEVRVSLVVRDGWLDIGVADDGCGFPFQGRFDGDALAKRQLGPRTLRERVSALGGTLALESSGAGARLEMRLPLAAAAA